MENSTHFNFVFSFDYLSFVGLRTRLWLYYNNACFAFSSLQHSPASRMKNIHTGSPRGKLSAKVSSALWVIQNIQTRRIYRNFSTKYEVRTKEPDIWHAKLKQLLKLSFTGEFCIASVLNELFKMEERPRPVHIMTSALPYLFLSWMHLVGRLHHHLSLS